MPRSVQVDSYDFCGGKYCACVGLNESDRLGATKESGSVSQDLRAVVIHTVLLVGMPIQPVKSLPGVVTMNR